MLLFHYTYGNKVPLIYADGLIRPSRPRYPHEKGVLWLSSHPQWEATATKFLQMRTQSGEVKPVQATMATAASMVGLFRFAFDLEEPRVAPWPLIASLAKIRLKDRTLMTKKGLAIGALPSQWFGLLEQLEVAGAHVERLDPDRLQWAELSQQQAAAWRPLVKTESKIAP